MEDHRDSHYTPFAKPTAVRVREPGELLWALQKHQVVWTCELKWQGESYGWQALILRDGDLTISHRFLLREEAEGWAEEQRVDIERGWVE